MLKFTCDGKIVGHVDEAVLLKHSKMYQVAQESELDSHFENIDVIKDLDAMTYINRHTRIVDFYNKYDMMKLTPPNYLWSDIFDAINKQKLKAAIYYPGGYSSNNIVYMLWIEAITEYLQMGELAGECSYRLVFVPDMLRGY